MAGGKKIPQRQCVGCRQMKDKKSLVRVVRETDGSFRVDATGRKNGRGAYICKDVSCLEAAKRSRGLERSFKQAIPADVYDRLREEMTLLD